jgi:hypothetical protein
MLTDRLVLIQPLTSSEIWPDTKSGLTRLSILGTYFLANPQNSSIFEVCHPQGLHYTAPLGTSIVSGVNSLGGG